MKIFGTDGVRGVFGKFPLDVKMIRAIAVSAAKVLKKKTSSNLVIIGRDTRQSGPEIAEILSSEFSSRGIEVWDVGVIPTPGVSYLVSRYPVNAGIVVSASHNPFTDNGIKFFSHSGTKLSDKIEAEIEKNLFKTSFPTAANSGLLKKAKIINKCDLAGEYSKFLESSVVSPRGLSDLKIVLDCANGATSYIAPEVFRNLGADIVCVNNRPNGKNINCKCGSLHPEKLIADVKKNRADLGIAFDGDGDRVVFVDDKGNVRDGDYIISIAAYCLKKKKLLRNNVVAATVMANLGFFKAMKKCKIDVIKTSVGDRYVFEAMKQNDAVLGGEQSGHIIFREYLPTGDGMLSALKITEMLLEEGKTLFNMSSMMEKYPQVLINKKVSSKIPLEKLPDTQNAVLSAEKKLKGDGRVLVRYSGTENLIRVMIEGKDKGIINKLASGISKVAVNEIEVLS